MSGLFDPLSIVVLKPFQIYTKRVPVTFIVTLPLSSQKHGPYTLSLRINNKATISVIHRPDDLRHFYRIQWGAGKVQYSLIVCRPSVTSYLLKLSSHFKIKFNLGRPGSLFFFFFHYFVPFVQGLYSMKNFVDICVYGYSFFNSC